MKPWEGKGCRKKQKGKKLKKKKKSVTGGDQLDDVLPLLIRKKKDFSAKMCAYLCCSTCTRESVGINLRQKMEKVCQNCPTFLKASWMKACIWEKKESDTPAPHCMLQVFQAVVEADQLRRSFSPEWMWKCKKIVSRQKIPGVSKKTLCSEAYVNVSFLHRKKKNLPCKMLTRSTFTCEDGCLEPA